MNSEFLSILSMQSGIDLGPWNSGTQVPQIEPVDSGTDSVLHTSDNIVRYLFERFGGPEGIRTLDLFHAMEARSQLRHRPTQEG